MSRDVCVIVHSVVVTVARWSSLLLTTPAVVVRVPRNSTFLLDVGVCVCVCMCVSGCVQVGRECVAA
jgi:hypothetical protein